MEVVEQEDKKEEFKVNEEYNCAEATHLLKDTTKEFLKVEIADTKKHYLNFNLRLHVDYLKALTKMRLPPVAQLLFHYTAEVEPELINTFLQTSFPISTPYFTLNTDKCYVLIDMGKYISVVEKVLPFVTEAFSVLFGDFSDPSNLSRLVSACSSLKSFYLAECAILPFFTSNNSILYK